MRRSAVPLALAIACASAGCREPTQVDVVLRTDTACTELDGVEIAAAPTPAEAATRVPGASSRACSGGSIGDIVLVPDDAKDAKFSLRVVAGFKKPVESCRDAEDFSGVGADGSGCIEARRALSFIPHTPLELPIDLRRSCVGVPCPIDETCVRGGCVPATIRCQEGEPCDEDVLAGSGGGQSGAAGGGGGGGGGGGQGGGPGAIVAVYAGHQISCATLETGAVFCWGPNDYGRLGNGTEDDAVLDPAFTLPAGVAGKPAIGVAHGCVTGTDGVARCAGDDGIAQLGNGPGDSPSFVLQPTATLPAGVQLETGDAHTIALDPTGALWCWGNNNNRECAATNLSPVDVPVAFPGYKWKAVSAGSFHTCGVDTSDQLRCWGSNFSLQCGVTGTGMVPNATVVQVGGVATDASAGGSHTCALVAGGVVCWGLNDNGQICDGPSVPASATPTPCPIPAQVVQVAASSTGACALDAAGGVHCWGAASLVNGQRTGAISSPAPVLDGAKQISVGFNHACALTRAGQVLCWGSNNRGQVNGLPVQDQVLMPTTVLVPP